MLFAVLVGMALVGCSDDPRVAPKSIYIVDTDDMQNRVAFSSTEGMRVIYMKPKETVQLGAITNRLSTNDDIVWSSNATYVATVENGEKAGLVTAMNTEGVTTISVEAPGVKKQAVCLVIVQLDKGQSLDPGSSDGMYIQVNCGGLGGYIDVTDGSLNIEASTVEELKEHRLTISWKDENNVYAYDHFDWQIEGVPVIGAQGQVFTYGFQSFGRYHVSCTAYAKDAFDNVYCLGSYEVVVRTMSK